MNKHQIDQSPLSDGNYVIVDKDSEVEDGDVALAVIDNSATLKIFKKQNDMIVLYPNSYNETHQPIYLDKGRENIINGKVVMVLEKSKL